MTEENDMLDEIADDIIDSILESGKLSELIERMESFNSTQNENLLKVKKLEEKILDIEDRIADIEDKFDSSTNTPNNFKMERSVQPKHLDSESHLTKIQDEIEDLKLAMLVLNDRMKRLRKFSPEESESESKEESI